MASFRYQKQLPMAAALISLWAWAQPAHAGWAACSMAPAKACVLEEAKRGKNGPLNQAQWMNVLNSDVSNHEGALATHDAVVEALRYSAATGDVSASLMAIGPKATKEERLAIADKVLNDDPSRLRVYIGRLVRQLIRTGDTDIAMSIPERARKIGDWGEYCVSLAAQEFASSGRPDLAVNVLETMKDLGLQKRSEIEFAVGRAYLEKGEKQLAASYLKRALADRKASPEARTPPIAYLEIANLLRLSALDGKSIDVQSLMPGLPDSPAIEFWKQVEQNLDRSIGLKELVTALLDIEQPTKAVELVEATLKSDSDSFRGEIGKIGEWYIHHGQLDAAENLAPRAVYTLKQEVLWARAQAAAKHGDVKSALGIISTMSDYAFARNIALVGIARALPN